MLRSLINVRTILPFLAPIVVSAQEPKPSHVVKLSDLKVSSTASAGPVVEFSVLLFDEKGDIGDPKDLTIKYVLYCADGQALGGYAYGSAASKEPKQALVRATTSKTPGFSAVGNCDFEIRFKDTEGIESNRLTAKVEFKV